MKSERLLEKKFANSSHCAYKVLEATEDVVLER